MSIVIGEELTLAVSGLVARVAEMREKRKRSEKLERLMCEFAELFYSKMSDFTDEDHPTDIMMTQNFHKAKLMETNRFFDLLEAVAASIDLRSCIIEAICDASPAYDVKRTTDQCVVCSQFRGAKVEVGDHGHRETGPSLAVCKRCVAHLKKTEAPNTGDEQPCKDCGFVHAWIPDAVYGMCIACLADSVASDTHDFTPLGIFFASEALKMFNVVPHRGEHMLSFYRDAYVGKVPHGFEPCKLPAPGCDEATAKALLAICTYHDYFPLCFKSEAPMHDSRNVRRK